jgi:hypothetical protein
VKESKKNESAEVVLAISFKAVHAIVNPKATRNAVRVFFSCFASNGNTFVY